MSIHVKDAVVDQEVFIYRDSIRLEGILSVPEFPKGIVLFAHGAGSNRFSPRNQYVAESLLESGYATLLVNLLTQQEQRRDQVTGKLRFNVPLMAGRVDMATDWIEESEPLASLEIAYFGAGTGAAAALVAAVQRPLGIKAILCRGGRLDLPLPVLADIKAPTLLMVGERDELIKRRNLEAVRKMQCDKKLVVVPGAGHLFEEPGALDAVVRHSSQWLREQFLY